MPGEDLQSLRIGDAVVFEDAYTNETKYGRVDRGYGSTLIARIIPCEEAGPNPRPLGIRRPCKLVARPDGVRICDAHMTELAETDLHADQNPPGLGHLKAWICTVSGKHFLESEGL